MVNRDQIKFVGFCDWRLSFDCDFYRFEAISKIVMAHIAIQQNVSHLISTPDWFTVQIQLVFP